MIAAPAKRSRFWHRTEVVTRALGARAGPRRSAPTRIARVLVAHHLLLGDTLMLTALLAKLREVHPAAEIAMTVPRAMAPLYATRPYGVRVLPWDPRTRDPSLYAEAPFDVAYVPGDNRYAWLAAAMRARWIVAFAGDRPARKNWPVDELLPYPDTPAAWSDMVAALVPGPAPTPYDPRAWPAPPHTAFALPAAPYAVLHIGASTILKQWLPQRWMELGDWLIARGITPVWSAGAGEAALVTACDPGSRFRSTAGQLDLAQLRHLLVNAAALIAPDTGAAHLGRTTGTPTVALFGPGSAIITGAGDFWCQVPYRAVTVDPFPCRDQRVLFRREIAWVRRCGRSTAECAEPRCMHAISVAAVTAALTDLGVGQ